MLNLMIYFSERKRKRKEKKVRIYKDLQNNLREIRRIGYTNDLECIIFTWKCFTVSRPRVQPCAFLFISCCGPKTSIEDRNVRLRRQVIERRSPSHQNVCFLFSSPFQVPRSFWLHVQTEPRHYLCWGFPREARDDKVQWLSLLTLH